MSWWANDAYIGRSLDLYGEYSESEIELLRHVVNKNDVVLDVGANVGGLTVALAAISKNVIAFEPQPKYFQLLSENSKHHPNFLAINRALGDSDEIIQLEDIEIEKINAPGWKRDMPTNDIYQCRIDDYNFPQVDLIKIDVDGPELDILKGAENTISRHRPYLYVEHDKPDLYPDLIPWIRNQDYRLYSVTCPLYNPHNWNGLKLNVFGNTCSLMLLCIPNEVKYVFPMEWKGNFDVDKIITKVKYV